MSKVYEYKILQETDTTNFTLKDVNELGKEGWRVVSWDIDANGREAMLMEKEINGH